MARFDIISKDGSIIRYSGKPRYIGTYLKPSHLEFNEIASPVPIAWEVGDYVDYPRTGMRYYLYSIPQPTKKARKDTYGGAFVYSGVQFHAATKELEIAPFRDLVSNDNNIHFSTAPDVATFENVEGIARRIQACMDDLYPGRWEIRIAEFDAVLDAEIVEKISEAKDFALSGGTCLDALSRIYELWQDIGWIHSYENGKEVITIGYANKRIDANTTDSYLYGKGNGLTAIKRNQTNKDEFATRLYVYGSERNLPARYYNGLDILNAESVDIRNLMLPLDSWGVTDELPDARKAYLENAEAVAKYGVIPKTHYFDSDDAGADIYPSIEGMTIGHIRKVLADMGQSQYSPSTSIYPDDSERVDEVLSVKNPDDDGILKRGGKQYDDSQSFDISDQYEFTIGTGSENVIYHERVLVNTTFDRTGMAKISISPNMNIIVLGESLASVKAKFVLANAYSEKWRSAGQTMEVEGVLVGDSTTNWSIKIPYMAVPYTKQEFSSFPVYLIASIYITPASSSERSVTVIYPSSELEVNFARILPSTFTIDLKQIGFDIETQASLGEGKVISMKTGSCAGRNFEIVTCVYQGDTDSWSLTCKRQQDDTLGMLFPYADYPIEGGDRFVLLEIAMPEPYIRIAMERLLTEGQKLLARASKIQSNYEPSVDAKVMMESGRTLREGMFMEISDQDVVDNGTDYMLIDTLNIYEDESAIPTYKVTLRERRKVSYKGTPSATSTTSTKSVETDDNTPDVDLTGYAKETYVDEKVKAVSDLLASMWSLDPDYNLVTDKQVIIKNNLVIHGDTASGGEGESNPVGISGITVNGVTYRDTDGDGLIDLGTIESGVAEITSAMVIEALGYTPYNASNPSGYITASALNGYATQSWVEGKNYLTSHQTIHALTIKNSAGTTQLTYTPNSGAGSLTLTKAMVGLGNVENTALSTWAGSAKITTLGTITSGTWNGSKIANAYLANSAMTIAGNSVSLGGSLAVATLQSSLGLGSLAYKSSLVASDIPNLDWSKITSGKPTTVAGYGITDAITTGNIGSQSVNYATSAGSATKLATARTIWGQSFDGTGNVSGALTLPLESAIESEGCDLLRLSSSLDLTIGYGVAGNARNTYISGNYIYLRYGTSRTLGLTLNPSGNVTIGSSDLAGTSAKLYVSGASSFANNRVIIPINGDRITFNADSGYTMGILAMNAGNTYIEAPLATNSSTGAKTPIIIGWRDGTYPFFISASANVGIGTTSPAYKLDVAGTGRFTGGTLIQGGLSVSSVFSNDGTAGVAGVFIRNEGGIEISHASTPYIDFHHANSTSDFSHRLIARTSTVFAYSGNYFCPWGKESLGSTSYRWDNVYANNGNFSGNVIVSGDVASGSDIRYKDFIAFQRIKVEDIAEAPLFTFRWNDREDKAVHLGTSAQYWDTVAPWLVKGEDFKTLDYSTLGVAIGISLANKSMNHEERIKILEKENKALKGEIRRMRHGLCN